VSKISFASFALWVVMLLFLSSCSEFSCTNEEQIEKNKLLLPPEVDRLPTAMHKAPKEQQD
jgi:hypothetical protein